MLNCAESYVGRINYGSDPEKISVDKLSTIAKKLAKMKTVPLENQTDKI